MLIFPLVNDTSRKIIHIDMDAFFASIEERDNPQLKGKPVVIGRDPRLSNGRGVVATANYQARQYGIHSAMSTSEAYKRCPQAIFIASHHEHYRQVGQQVRNIFYRYTDLVEPVSIDEAYLDVTDNKMNISSAIKIARLIQKTIWEELHLTCSAGVSYNKFLAKMASDYQKPKGLTVVLPGKAESFLSPLPIEKFHGVGQKTVQKLHDMEVFTGSDLLTIPEMTLIDTFGRFGFDLYRKARGIHLAPVNPQRIRKSIGKEKTYGKPLILEEDIHAELAKLAKQVSESLQKKDFKGKTIVVKVRYADFRTVTKRRSLKEATSNVDTMTDVSQSIFDELNWEGKEIRLLGVTVTNFS